MAISSLTTSVQIIGTQTGTNDITTPLENFAQRHTTDWTNGTSTNQCNKVWADTRTLTASSAEDLDLAAGSATDSFGNLLTFTAIKFIYVSADSGNTNNVEVGGAVAPVLGIFDDATDKILVKPGGVFYWEAPGTGATVTATTGDDLNVNNGSSGTSVTYTIIIGGLA